MIAHLHPLTNVLLNMNCLHLTVARYSPDKFFKLKVTVARSKVKSRSHHDGEYLHLVTNVLVSINILHIRVSLSFSFISNFWEFVNGEFHILRQNPLFP